MRVVIIVLQIVLLHVLITATFGVLLLVVLIAQTQRVVLHVPREDVEVIVPLLVEQLALLLAELLADLHVLLQPVEVHVLLQPVEVLVVVQIVEVIVDPIATPLVRMHVLVLIVSPIVLLVVDHLVLEFVKVVLGAVPLVVMHFVELDVLELAVELAGFTHATTIALGVA